MARGPDGVDFVERMRDGITPRCKKVVVHIEGHLSYYDQCSRSGKVKLEDGTWRCMQHVPAVEARRRQKNAAKADEAWQRRREEIYGHTFLAALKEIAAGHNDPRALAQRVLARFNKTGGN